MILGDFRQAHDCIVKEKLETELLTFVISVQILVSKYNDKKQVHTLWSQDKR